MADNGVNANQGDDGYNVVIDPGSKKKGEETWSGLDLSNQGLYNVSENIGFYTHLTSLFLSNNNLVSLPKALFSNLTNLTHLDLGYNRLTHIPPEIEELQNLKRLLLYHNRITELPFEMGRLWRLSVLSIEGNPITSPNVSILQQGTEHIISYLRDRVSPTSPPPERQWISYIENEVRPPEGFKFRVTTYNILAETYATPERHPYVPCWALEVDYRKKQILAQLKQYESDVICLQEVEAKQYQEFFEPQLASAGYGGVFKPKSRARTMNEWSNVDGCAIFYLREKFRIIDEYLIEYQSLALSRFSDLTGDRTGLERLMTKDNVAVVCVLQQIQTPQQQQQQRAAGRRPNSKQPRPQNLLIANTHIHWDPAMSDVKLVQVQFLVEELMALRTRYKDPTLPMIVCGDFNSTPSSAVYQLLQSGEVTNSSTAFNGFNFGRYTDEGVHHSLRLNSAYAAIGEPAFTNFNGDFIGVLDYLWYTEPSLKALGVLQPFSLEDIRQQKSPLPNPHFPSDHLLLTAEFEITIGTSTTSSSGGSGGGSGSGGGKFGDR